MKPTTGLAAAHEEAHEAERLAVAGAALLPGTPAITAVSSRSGGRGRVVAAAELAGGPGIVVKRGDDALRGHRIATDLGRLQVGAALRIPQPLAADAASGVTVQRRVTGAPFGPLVAAAPYRWTLVLGRALAELHALPAPASLGRTTSLADHLDALFDPHPELLALQLPQHAPAIHDVLGEIHRRSVLSSPDAPGTDGPVHRDVHLRQCLAEGDVVWLTDWDLAARGDAALDIGNLRASLRRHHADAIADEAIVGLADGYLSVGAPEVLDRAPVYEALTWLRFACKHHRITGAAGSPAVADALGRAAGLLA